MNNQRGYTVIELVIVLTLLGILMAFAIGPIRGLMLRNQVRTEVELLQLDIAFTRSEAISRAYPAVIVPNGEWKEGWRIFVDKNNNGILDGDEEDLRISAFETDSLSLTDSADNDAIIFTAMGSLKSATERTISITHSELRESRDIFISAAGTVSVRRVMNEQ